MHALLLTASLVLAQDDGAEVPLGEPTHGLKVLGFTRDHQAVVYSGYFGEDELAREVTVSANLRGGAPRFLGETDAAAFLAKTPLDSAIASRTSPDGKSIAEVVVDASDTSGSWMKGVWKAEKSSAWDLSVTRNGVTTTAGTASPADLAEVFWSPDGRYTAWILSVASRGMRDPGSQQLVIASDGRPTASVVMEKAKLAAWAPKISALIDQGGYAVLATSAAQKARPSSVVFVKGGQEKAAKELAAKLPGGATVELLTWPSATDIVVYLAASALK